MPEAKPRILVVEDDASMQDFLTTFLEQEGYKVRWAGHGGIARQLLQTEGFGPVDAELMEYRHRFRCKCFFGNPLTVGTHYLGGFGCHCFCTLVGHCSAKVRVCNNSCKE